YFCPLLSFFCPILCPPPRSTLFPYTTLLRSVREDFGLARFDYNVSTRDSFSADYLISDGDKNDPRPDTNFTQISRNRSQVVALRSEEHTSDLQSLRHLVCRLLLEKKKKKHKK